MPNTYTDLIPEAGLQDKNLYIIAVNSNAIAGGGGSGDGASTPVTTTTTGVGASQSSSIPANATSWAFQLLSGTGTFQGVSIPTGLPLNGTGPGTAPIAYTTGVASSAILMYQTA